MAEAQIAYRPMARGLPGGLLITLLIHGGLGVFLWLSNRSDPAVQAQPRDVIVTQMVKLGKPREKFWLPRAARPKRQAPRQQIKVANKPNAAPATKTKEPPRPKDVEVRDNAQRALDRARLLAAMAEEENDEGQLDGSEFGSANEAKTGDAYLSGVNVAIHRNWNVPVGIIPDAELKTLSAEIKVTIAATGALSSAGITRSSGNATFDASALQAIKATPTVSAPPADQRNQLARGILIQFAP